MFTDIEIAQKCNKEKITDIAKKVDIPDEYLELYGNYKAKVDYKLLKDKADKKNGKLILVTAINPTPAGEGKTTMLRLLLGLIHPSEGEGKSCHLPKD